MNPALSERPTRPAPTPDSVEAAETPAPRAQPVERPAAPRPQPAREDEREACHSLLHAEERALDELEHRLREREERREPTPAAPRLPERLTPAQRLFVGAVVLGRRPDYAPRYRRRRPVTPRT